MYCFPVRYCIMTEMRWWGKCGSTTTTLVKSATTNVQTDIESIALEDLSRMLAIFFCTSSHACPNWSLKGKASNGCNTNCLQELGRCFVHVQVRFVCWAMMLPKSPSIFEGIKRTERRISRVELIILVGFFLASAPCTQVEKVPFDSCKQGW